MKRSRGTSLVSPLIVAVALAVTAAHPTGAAGGGWRRWFKSKERRALDAALRGRVLENIASSKKVREARARASGQEPSRPSRWNEDSRPKDGRIFELKPIAQRDLDQKRQMASLSRVGTEYRRSASYDAIAAAGPIKIDLRSRELKRFARAAVRLRGEPNLERKTQLVLELIETPRRGATTVAPDGRRPRFLLGLKPDRETPEIARPKGGEVARLSDFVRARRIGPREMLLLTQLGLQYAGVRATIRTGKESIHARRYMSSFDETPAVWIEAREGGETLRIQPYKEPAERVSKDGSGALLHESSY